MCWCLYSSLLHYSWRFIALVKDLVKKSLAVAWQGDVVKGTQKHVWRFSADFWGFPKTWVFLLKIIILGVCWGYQHLRKHPSGDLRLLAPSWVSWRSVASLVFFCFDGKLLLLGEPRILQTEIWKSYPKQCLSSKCKIGQNQNISNNTWYLWIYIKKICIYIYINEYININTYNNICVCIIKHLHIQTCMHITSPSPISCKCTVAPCSPSQMSDMIEIFPLFACTCLLDSLGVTPRSSKGRINKSIGN